MQDEPDIAVDHDLLVHVGFAELEVLALPKRAQVVGRPGDEVVERQHADSAIEQGSTEVRADETGSARHHSPSASRGQCPGR